MIRDLCDPLAECHLAERLASDKRLICRFDCSRNENLRDRRALKCVVSECFQSLGKRHLCKRIAAHECIAPDCFHTCRDLDCCQIFVILECAQFDLRDRNTLIRCRNRDRSCRAGILLEHSMIFLDPEHKTVRFPRRRSHSRRCSRCSRLGGRCSRLGSRCCGFCSGRRRSRGCCRNCIRCLCRSCRRFRSPADDRLCARQRDPLIRHDRSGQHHQRAHEPAADLPDLTMVFLHFSPPYTSACSDRTECSRFLQNAIYYTIRARIIQLF